MLTAAPNSRRKVNFTMEIVTAVLDNFKHIFPKGCISVNCDSTCITVCDRTSMQN